jgi:hypothetical protein
MATPITTAAVNHGRACSQGGEELSKTLMSLSRADMELSKAEASFGRLEAAWIKWAKITIVLLLAVMTYGMSLIILALREEAVYKKFIKRQYKA